MPWRAYSSVANWGQEQTKYNDRDVNNVAAGSYTESSWADSHSRQVHVLFIPLKQWLALLLLSQDFRTQLDILLGHFLALSASFG
jgi:hypothetical protein